MVSLTVNSYARHSGFRLDTQSVLVVFAEKMSLATMLSSVCSLAIALVGVFGTLGQIVCPAKTTFSSASDPSCTQLSGQPFPRGSVLQTEILLQHLRYALRRRKKPNDIRCSNALLGVLCRLVPPEEVWLDAQ